MAELRVLGMFVLINHLVHLTIVTNLNNVTSTKTVSKILSEIITIDIWS